MQKIISLKLAPFLQRPFAHRGLHQNNNIVPENTLAASRRALENGYGIELDIQRTKDNVIVVFHDDDLKRLMGINRRVSDLNYCELKDYRTHTKARRATNASQR